MTDHDLEAILREVFAAEGALDAAGLAARAVRDFDMAKRDSDIYKMRASMTVAQIHARTGLSVQRIKQIQKEQLEIRRHPTSNAA